MKRILKYLVMAGISAALCRDAATPAYGQLNLSSVMVTNSSGTVARPGGFFGSQVGTSDFSNSVNAVAQSNYVAVARAVTNGYAWGPLYDSAGSSAAAQAAAEAYTLAGFQPISANLTQWSVIGTNQLTNAAILSGVMGSGVTMAGSQLTGTVIANTAIGSPAILPSTSGLLYIATTSGNGGAFTETTGTQPTLTGSTLSAGAFSGSGSGLTALPAGNLTGTVPLAALPSQVVTNIIMYETNYTFGAYYSNNFGYPIFVSGLATNAAFKIGTTSNTMVIVSGSVPSGGTSTTGNPGSGYVPPNWYFQWTNAPLATTAAGFYNSSPSTNTITIFQ